jgi:hypothetical protein
MPKRGFGLRNSDLDGWRRVVLSRCARAASAGHLARLLCAGVALSVLATGCAGPRPLEGGRAVITRKPTGVFEQTLVQSENPAQATKQDQESVKVRSYTVPAGSRGRSPSRTPTLNPQPPLS